MHPEQKEPYKVYQAGGRDFPVYLEYDEHLGECHPAYPDFEAHPEYTGGGRPFVTAVQERCLCAKPKASGEPTPGDCGGCEFFHREQTPYNPIGVCMCEARRRENETKSEREEAK
ncbi:MAG: hypothetical protein LLF87_05935 [Eubacteriales bacterium]|nr:hypothetical protein [Eubacteriales bacterium]